MDLKQNSCNDTKVRSYVDMISLSISFYYISASISYLQTVSSTNCKITLLKQISVFRWFLFEYHFIIPSSINRGKILSTTTTTRQPYKTKNITFSQTRQESNLKNFSVHTCSSGPLRIGGGLWMICYTSPHLNICK